MTSIDTRYPAAIPVQGSAAAAGSIKATAQRAGAGGAQPADIDWSSFGRTTSHRAITVSANATGKTGETLDSLVDSVLSHIGSRIPG